MHSPTAATRAAALFLVAAAPAARAQNGVTTYAEDIPTPIGIEIDVEGRLWVAQLGTANNDGSVSIVTTDGAVHPFLVGLPSTTLPTGEVAGTNHVYFDGDGNLVILQADGDSEFSSALLLVDTTGFAPGDDPLTDASIHTTYDIGSFLETEGYPESNPYTLAPGPDGDLYIVDAAANVIVRRADASGDLDVFASFPDVPNETGVGPPMVDAVPTGIAWDEERFVVGSLTGFPFGNGAASVYEVDLDGTVSALQDGLTTIVDVGIDPRDGAILVLQHAEYSPPPPPFLPNSGGVFRLREDGGRDTLAYGLNRPSGMRIAADGDVFVASLVDGAIYRIEAEPTGIEPEPEIPSDAIQASTYPNPFGVDASIRFSLATSDRVKVSIFNVLGQEIRRLFDATRPDGMHEVVWDGRDDVGARVVAGLYVYQIRTSSGAVAGTMTFFPQ